MPFVHSTLSKYKSALKKYAYIANNADKKREASLHLSIEIVRT